VTVQDNCCIYKTIFFFFFFVEVVVKKTIGKGIYFLMTSQHSIQIERSADKRDMSERLWKVSECFSSETNFFSVQTHMIGKRQHFLQTLRQLIFSSV